MALSQSRMSHFAWTSVLACLLCVLSQASVLASRCLEQTPQSCDAVPGCVSCYSDDALDAAFTCSDRSTAAILETSTASRKRKTFGFHMALLARKSKTRSPLIRMSQVAAVCWSGRHDHTRKIEISLKSLRCCPVQVDTCALLKALPTSVLASNTKRATQEVAASGV